MRKLCLFLLLVFMPVAVMAAPVTNRSVGGILDILEAGTAGQYLAGDGAGSAPTWTTPVGAGDVLGPASATDGNVVMFDGITGKLIKDSGLTLSGSNTGDQVIPTSVDELGPSQTGNNGKYLTTDGTNASWDTPDTGYTNLTQFNDQTAWRLFYSDTSGDVTELALGADGTYLKSNGAAVAPTFSVPTGSGDVLGPASATDGNVVMFDGATGKLIKDSGLTLSGSNTGDSGTVTSVSALTIGTTGTDISSTVATGTTTPVITLQVPTASAANRGALSSANWSAFNAKQPAGNYITALTGDVTASGPGSVAATIAANAVALGTDTTGSYIATITGTADEVTVTGSGAESATVTISLPATINANTTGNAATSSNGNFTQDLGAATLTTITAGTNGSLRTIIATSNSAIVNETGNIILNGATTFDMDTGDVLTLVADGATWREIGRSFAF